MSFAQERLWFLDQLQPGNLAYNLPTALRLIGSLDVAALAQSMNTIMRRHEALRTTFAMEAGRPVQVIAPAYTVALIAPLRLIDLQNLSEAEREAAAQRLAVAELECSFDLARGPLVRMTLLRLGADAHVLLLTLHHIVADGWSVGVFTQELSTLYTGYAARRPAALPELPIQYADYAVWQRAWLQGSGVGGQGATTPLPPPAGAGTDLPPPAGGGTEGGRSQESDVGERTIQNSKLKTQNSPLEVQLAYWRTQLADLQMLELPSDHPRPATRTFRGAAHNFVLASKLSADLAALSRAEGATLFMVLLAAFQALLARYSGQDDIVVGTPIANRTQAETEALIGYFVNSLVLRTDLSAGPTFRQVLGRVRAVALDAYAHQDLPFEQVVETLQPARTSSHHPLFQVMFALQNAPVAPLDLPGLTLRPLTVEDRTAKLDLSLFMEEVEIGLAGMFGYSTDLFEAATIARLSEHFQTLLEGAIAQPDLPFTDLPLLTDAERQQLLVEWNATQAVYPQDQCLHQLFEAQAARTPEAVAVVFEGPLPGVRGQGSEVRGQEPESPIANRQSPIPNTQHPTPNTQHLTYQELNARANRLARYLQEQGVGPDVPVGLCLARSLELVVALLGILKAGGAYVPLDPTYPPERLAFMLEDAQVAVLIMTNDDRPTTNDYPFTPSPLHPFTPSPLHLVTLSRSWSAIARCAADNPVGALDPANLAYVIYTSGTTGRPKAVLVEHRHVVNTLCASQAIYHFGPHDRVPCLLSFSFDIALFECLSPLLVGGVSVLVPEPQTLDKMRWERVLADSTFLHGTPSLLGPLVRDAADGVSQYPHLRQVAVGGDVVPTELLRGLQRVFAAAQIHVGYGPTEGTIMCTNYRVPRDVPLQHIIGRPMRNMQVRLYDRHRQLVPVGVAGELYLGGAGVTRGYLNREELTNQKYVMIDGQRWYRTGDRARYLPDGNLAFLGRLDEQVKVRGYRIELGEVAAVLGQHPTVRDCVVVVREDVPGEQRLVAYVVPHSTETATITELRRFLQVQLPEYMLPAAFVFLGALPLTPTGKVNRNALPIPDQARPALEKVYTAPRTELERLLATMWQDILGLEAVGIHDNFFELGGNSIQAAIFINKLQEKAREMVYVVAVFDAPTVAELAVYLTKRYPNVVANVCGIQSPPDLQGERESRDLQRHGKVDAAKVAAIRQAIPPLPPRATDDSARTSKNPAAVFILSPPRSGSTLLRVMLAGHPRLFAPPALEMLSFNTLADRREAFSGRNRFWLEGAIRAIMEIKGYDVVTAEQMMAEWENQNLGVQQFYRLIQEWIGDKVLVDKSPSYTLDQEVLNRAEEDFEQARYIHLLRHPYGMTNSFEAAKIDQVFFRYPHSFATRELAELIWLICHQNIVEFLRQVPPERQYCVRFEDLLAQPKDTLEGICQFLGLEFHPDLLEPYKDAKRRMTDGIHAFSKMVGDVRFHEHRMIDATVSERWRQRYREDFLGDITWELAAALGYPRTPQDNTGVSPIHPALTPIQPIPRDGSVVLPLSFAQQRLWFVDQLQPFSSAYNIPLAVRLTGRLDLPALARSLIMIVQRHEVLRTTIATADGQPVQVIAPVHRVSLPLLDLTGLPSDEREAAAQQLALIAAQQPFDLARGPLLRVGLLRMSADVHALLLTLHHIVTDGWSMGVLIDEFTALYAAYTTGTAAALPALPIQYADYAVWQRAWLQGAVLEEQLAYWRTQLANLPVLHLPTDYPRPPTPSFRGTHLEFVLPSTLHTGLLALSRAQGVTLFMTLLAAWKLLLARYSGQNDIAVGTDVANRNRAETERLIGFFINQLVLRTDLHGNPTFRAVLQQVRERTLAAYSHQELPFEQLVAELQPERHLNRTPLFQVKIILQNVPTGRLTLPDLTIEPLVTMIATVQFDLTLSIVETEAGLAGTLAYSTDLFTADTIERLLGHFQTLLNGVVADPERRLGDLPLLTEAERQQALVTWNATQGAFRSQESGVRSETACIQNLFAAQAARTPDAIALVFEGSGVRETRSQESGVRSQNDRSPLHPFTPSPLQQLTYHELNRRANQLAHYLQRLGVGPEVRVALSVERSLELLIGLLGILKAGGVYVPLDPTYPPERMTFLLADSQAAILLTLDRLMDELPTAWVPAVRIEADWTQIAQESVADPITAVQADNLAYVIYTSGSTGTPKGVQVAHGGVVNLAQAQVRAFDVLPDSRVLQFASFGFDAAVSEVVMALLGGATLCLGSRDSLLPGLELIRLMRDQAITHVTLPPSALAALPVAELPALRTIIAAGEACSGDVVGRWACRHRFWNAYGPTETTVCATMAECHGDGRSPAIGRPITNAQVYLLDPYLHPVPVGVAGELYIGGVGLARGYLGRPDLTAERFIPNPFWGMGDKRSAGGGLGWGMEDSLPIPHPPSPIPRLYKTGDLARYRVDGNIEFLGRIDQQVKLRGFRIELGEIESVLGQHPAVRACAVTLREDVLGEKRLVAYVVPKIEDRGLKIEDSNLGSSERLSSIFYPLSSELRDFLQTKLPAYMIPAVFVPLDALPLTPHGKLDRRALPIPDNTRPALEDVFVAGQTPFEELLARIWADVLNLDRVGIHDNFFDLGGHSLLATQVVARVREVFAVDLPLRSLFEAPTVAELVEKIATLRAAPQLHTPPLVPVARDRALPLSFAQQRLWFLDQLQPGSSTYNMPASVRMHGSLDVVALQQSLNAIIGRHEVLRTTFARVDGTPIQVIAPAQTTPLPLFDLQTLPDHERERAALQLATDEAQQPFDLARGPLLRVSLLRLDVDVYVLLLNMHHIVTDGWSMGVFIGEFVALYTAYMIGTPAVLPALQIQYADYAVWQRAWLQGAVLEAQLAYWKEHLAGIPTLDLPTDHPRPPIATFRGAPQDLVLPLALHSGLLALSQAEGVTLFMTLLAAFQVLLARYSEQDDIAVGTLIANRTRAETEGLIGFFANTLVLRTDLRGNPTFRTALRRVREVCLGAYAHQDLPFEQVVEALQPERDMGRHPLFQVVFALQNAPQAAVALPGLTLQPLAVEHRVARFDLSLSLTETGAGLAGMLTYSTDLFTASTIERMLGHFQTLLDGVVADPERRLADLPLLTEAERQQALVTWNATQANYPRDHCIHQLFEAQVARSPDTVALVFDGPGARGQGSGVRETRSQESGVRSQESGVRISGAQHPTPNTQHLTYDELNQRANRLARHLRVLGVGPEVRVGLCVERSLDLVIGLLGILKASGTYIPLDPAYPLERLHFMLDDAQAVVLLIQERLADSLPMHTAIVVSVDTDWQLIAQQSVANPSSEAAAENLAYIMYTSGSTGQPKGIGIPHRAVNRLVCNANYAQMMPEDRVAQTSNTAFDASIFEIWGALLHGARLVLVPTEVVLSPQNFAAQIHAHGLSTVFLTTALFNQLAHDIPSAFRSVRHLFFGGEAADPRSVDVMLAQGAPMRLLHMYGPAESTTYASWYLVQDVPPGASTIPIGRPITNTQMYILDRHMQVVPVGIPGELYIGGYGLARGYINQPGLTAQRFVPNPFAEGMGDKRSAGGGLGWGMGIESSIPHPPSPIPRLYKTGDLARYRPDGAVEFLGRNDDQVKIRGFRIELGEIEAVLGQHPAIRACVVLAREDAPGERRLVAYLVTSDKSQVTSEGGDGLVTRHSSLLTQLRVFLKEHLPDYMVPSAFVFLETFPLTASGKVDRRALPAPDQSRSATQRSYVAARDIVELKLVQIWEDLLAIHPIGVTDNFFELSGHSLLAVRLMAYIQQQFEQELSLSTLFQGPTIEQIAALLRQRTATWPYSPVVTLRPGGSKPPLFLVHPGGGTIFCYIPLVQYLDPDQPVYGLQARGLEAGQEPYSCVEDMAAHYVEALRNVQPQGPYLLGGWSSGGVVAFEMAQQLHRQGQKVALLAVLDSRASAPGDAADLPELDLADIITLVIGEQNLPMSYDAFRQLDPDEQLNYALEVARKANFLPPDVGPARIRRLLRVFNLNIQATARYVPQVYPNRITLFKAEAPIESARTPETMIGVRDLDETLGWGKLSTQPVAVDTIPGTHETMVLEPHVQVLAERLRGYLDAVVAPT